jgi:hypothetical protein
MSKWLNAGTMLGGVSGAIVAAVALWQALQPGPIEDAEGVVDALHGIRDAIEAGRVDLSQPDIQAEVAAAAQPVAGLLARNLNALSPDQIAGLGGLADARPGETVELRQPDGGIARITLLSWNPAPPNAVLVVDGERIVSTAGWSGSVGTGGCTMTFAGATREEAPTGRFRLACPETPE